ncbi:hypothetical protein PanWU01x14_035330, partial [Parasponia andersonii]
YHDILPSFGNLQKSGINIFPGYGHYRNRIESVWHALVHCEIAKTYWGLTVWWHKIESFRGETMDEFLLFLFILLDKHNFAAFCVVLWYLWYERNKFIHKQVNKDPSAIIIDARTF